MKATKRALLAVTLLLAVAPHVPAQGAKPGFKIVEKTEDGLTYVSLDAMPVEIPGAGGVSIELTASFSYVSEGREKIPFPFVTLGFTSRRTSFNFPNFGDAVFNLDGSVLRISGRLEDIERREGTVTSFAEPGVSWVDVWLPLKTFARIAAAERVEARIGSLTFRLSDGHLKALREFDRRVRSAEAGPPSKSVARR